MTTRFEVNANNDLVRRNGSFVRVDSVQQRLQTRLKILLGEWYLQRDEGMPIFTEVIGRSNIAHVRQLYRSRIVRTEGVTSLDKLELELNSTTRVLTIRFAVNGGPLVDAELGPV
jgi:hypothetical protein